MKLHQVISFWGGFIISSLIMGAICLFFLFLNFDLAGGETLQQVENQRLGLLLIAIIVSIIAVLAAKRYIKKGKKFTGYGIISISFICLVIASVYYFENYTFHTSFDKTVWEQSKWKPFNMSATLVKENKLIGLTRQQIKKLLGEGSAEYNDKSSDGGSIAYSVQNDWTLIIYFQKDKVIQTNMRLPFLGV